MSFHPKAGASRGASVFAALVFAVILAAAAATVQLVNPAPQSQAAAVSPAETFLFNGKLYSASADGTTPAPAAPPPPRRPPSRDAEKAELSGCQVAGSTQACPCDQAHETKTKTTSEKVCLPGCEYKVTASAKPGEKPNIQVTNGVGGPEGKLYSEPFALNITYGQLKQAGQCPVKYCLPDGKTCTDLKVTGSTPFSSEVSLKRGAAEAVAATVADPNATDAQKQQAIKDYQQNVGDAQALNDAFSAKQDEIRRKYDDPDFQKFYTNTVNDIKKLGCDTGAPTVPTEECVNLLNQRKAIESHAEDLGKSYQSLDAAKVVLAPGEPPAKPCPDGSTNCNKPHQEKLCTDPNCSPDQPPPPPPPPDRRPPSTFLPPDENDPNNSPECRKCQQNPSDQNACTACGRRNSGFGGGQGGGFGGQRGGGGYGQGQGGYPQQNSQQQCQPQYSCQGNNIMYQQCYPGSGYGGQGSGYAGSQLFQQCPQGYQCTGNSCQRQALWGHGTDGQPCQQPPQQPGASACTVGTWVAQSATNNGCTTGWKCVPNPTAPLPNIPVPTAQLSCEPRIADAGMTINFNFSCGNATKSSASASGGSPAFGTGNALSGTTTAIIQMPGDGSNRVTYTLTCTNDQSSPPQAASATCDVQTGRPSIVLVALPRKVPKGQQATIGWVTSGQKSCVLSDPDFPAWTQQQAGNTSTSGAAVTPAITQDTIVILACKTAGGADKSASVKISAI